MPNVSALIVCKALRRATFIHCTTVITRTYSSLTSPALIATGPALHRTTLHQADFSGVSTRTPRAISQLLPRQRSKASLLTPSRMTGKASPLHRDLKYERMCMYMHAVHPQASTWCLEFRDCSRCTSSHPESPAATMFATMFTTISSFVQQLVTYVHRYSSFQWHITLC